MAFLDNSGDIILDAVLTDVGRMRLAKGDGTFKITQFALGDDEIDYNLYDKTQTTAKQDLNILQTPILEAFTNNSSMLKSKLLTIGNNKLLYLPIMKLNESNAINKMHATNNALNKFIITADKDTSQGVFSSTGLSKDTGIMPNAGLLVDGYINGVDLDGTEPGAFIRIDQGIDNKDVSPTQALDFDLRETAYVIEIDGRLGSIVNSDGSSTADANFVRLGESYRSDDDFMVSYYLTLASTGDAAANTGFVTDIGNLTSEAKHDTEIQGARGTRLEFKVRPSLEIQQSTTLFSKLGKTNQTWTLASSNTVTPTAGASTTVHYIDTTVRVTGVSTGYRLDVPIRIVKKVSS
tara:strand:+ start:4561 stop:5610 length:1050 start_codon:yes stop_codon:yes gene_type:complete